MTTNGLRRRAADAGQGYVEIAEGVDGRRAGDGGDGRLHHRGAVEGAGDGLVENRAAQFDAGPWLGRLGLRGAGIADDAGVDGRAEFGEEGLPVPVGGDERDAKTVSLGQAARGFADDGDMRDLGGG